MRFVSFTLSLFFVKKRQVLKCYRQLVLINVQTCKRKEKLLDIGSLATLQGKMIVFFVHVGMIPTMEFKCAGRTRNKLTKVQSI